MERLMKGRTSIVIAHRLSTVRSLDRILVFDRG
jgi:ATP-binding cassette subfamily B protein